MLIGLAVLFSSPTTTISEIDLIIFLSLLLIYSENRKKTCVLSPSLTFQEDV